MSASELQIDLINKIANITDEVMLREILQLLRFQSDDSIYITSEEDKRAIAEAKNQINNGKILSNEDVQKAVRQCLKK